MTFGLIKWFDIEKGFGVIVSTKNSEEIFLHISNWKDKKNISSSNDNFLEFEIGLQRNKTTAINCKYFNCENSESWKKFLVLPENETILRIETKTYNLIELAFNNIPKNFNFQSIEQFVYEKTNLLNSENILNENPFYTLINNIKNHHAKDYLYKHFITKISKLDDDLQIEFWKKNLIRDFIPEKNIILKNFAQINIDLLKTIQEAETKNLIIIKQINLLSEVFEYDKFIEFGKILKIMEQEEFKKKILLDLEQIAETNYKELYLNSLKETLILSDNIYEVKKALSNYPDYISQYIEQKWNEEKTKTIIKYASIEIIIELWREKIVDKIDDKIIENLEKLTLHDCDTFISSKQILYNTKIKIIEYNFDKSNYEFVLNSCKNYFPDNLEEYNRKTFKKAEPSEYIELWSNGYVEIIPINYLNDYLDESKNKYSELDTWLNRKLISFEQTNSILLKKINSKIEIKNRKDFYTVYNSLIKYIELNNNKIDKIETNNNDFVQLLLWHLGHIEEFNLELLKRKYIYFKPKEQVYIFKRLFYLKHINKIDFTFNELDDILRADLDLYLVNEEFNNDFTLDISTHILIEAIKNYIQKGSFLFESDLILKDLKRNSKNKFQIKSYFDKCEGRKVPVWNWHNINGKVEKLPTPKNPKIFYFSLIFIGVHPMSTFYEEVKYEIEKLPSCRWIDKGKHWGVMQEYKNEVVELAKKYKFKIIIEGENHYTNNLHLVEFSREKEDGEDKIPIGIKFCEGRKAKKTHKKFNREFWWCVNQECFENATIDHLSDTFTIENDSKLKIWEYYTLLDILKILNINVDETTPMGDFIPNGYYYKFLGHINAFNRLLDKLYCEECGELLYPTQTSHFALYRDTRFHCENENCSEYKKTIYLNHCLNGECTNIIDSRLSQKCNNGWYICNSCGTCCSNEIFKRRLENLKLNGGTIFPDLVENVELEKGHLEKAEYYCYKCKGMMTEVSNTLFRCDKCKTEYNFEKYKWINRKWTMKNIRRKDYPH